MRKLIPALSISMLMGTLALASSGMPDINRTYQTHTNCHIAYDLLIHEVSIGQRPSREEIDWAKTHEEKSTQTGTFCPTAPADLLSRAADRVIATKEGLNTAMSYAEKQDDPLATFEIGFAFALGKFGPGERSGGIEIVGVAAEMGEPNAAYSKAVWLSQGLIGTGRDNASALPLLEVAAEAGHLDAMFNAGLFHLNGLGTAKNPEKSFNWFRRAAESGHLYAAIMAFDQISRGEGVRRDFDLAYRLARNVADDGEPYGMVLAASSLLQSKDPFKHQDEILYWLDQADTRGNAEIKAKVREIRAPLQDLFRRYNAPPQYVPRRRKPCPMKTVCLIDRYSGASSCTTNKDYWSDCDF